ncbi:MAG: 30S ribosomal protein S6 [Actinobacteria bacterium]|jgi:small subunit ribosomal protein S6|nr:30S ribosomal protein S6 [Actinomycetota bacterium]
MRAYELMVIISGKLEESNAHGWLKSISASITSVGGSVHGNPDWWGKRRLAYPIQKQDDGYYAVFNVVAPAGALDEVERGFRLSDDVLRHKLLRLPDDEAARRGMVSAA